MIECETEIPPQKCNHNERVTECKCEKDLCCRITAKYNAYIVVH